MRADLHLHSYYSDGSESPTGVVARAHAAGLELIALTDHDSMGGVAEARAAARPLGIGVIEAAEFTATLDGAEIHILGYFRASPNESVHAHLRQVQEFRRQRLETALERLRRRSLRLERGDLPAAPCCESLTMAHLAQLLVARGYVSSVRAAWHRYLAREQGIVPLFTISAEQVIAVIHASDGLAVWAHPHRQHLHWQLGELVARGLDGIEAYNGRRGREAATNSLACKHNLVVTGGSDWHGEGPLETVTDGLELEGFLRRMGLAPRSAAQSPSSPSR